MNYIHWISWDDIHITSLLVEIEPISDNFFTFKAAKCTVNDWKPP